MTDIHTTIHPKDAELEAGPLATETGTQTGTGTDGHTWSRLFGPGKIFALGDLAAFLASIVLAIFATQTLQNLLGRPVVGFFSSNAWDHALLAAAFGGVLIFWFRHRGHYRLRQPLSNQFRDIAGGCLLVFLLSGFAQFAAQEDTSRLLIGTTWVIAPGLVVVARLIIRSILIRTGLWMQTLVLIASPGRWTNAERLFEKKKGLGMTVGGTHTVADVAKMIAGRSDAELRELAPSLLGRTSNGLILVAPNAEEHAEGLAIVKALSRVGAPYVFAPDLGTIPVDRTDMQLIAPFDELHLVAHDAQNRPVAQLVKRVSDIAVSCAAILALSPFALGVILWIKRDGGPVLFAQTRIGKDGKPFRCYKFRTMVVDAEERLQELLARDPAAAKEWAETQKLTDDPRVTRPGRWLRRTSFDELPQLLNVLKGEMSLVGPRPVVPGELARYGDDACYYKRVRPGVTGVWQVNGRNSTDYAERVRLDTFYVRNWTLWRDFALLVKTIPEMLWERSGR